MYITINFHPMEKELIWAIEIEFNKWVECLNSGNLNEAIKIFEELTISHPQLLIFKKKLSEAHLKLWLRYLEELNYPKTFWLEPDPINKFMIPDTSIRVRGWTWLLGKAGMGKNRTLKRYINHDLNAGNWICIIDTNWDISNEIVIPDARAKDVIFLDFNDISTIPSFGEFPSSVERDLYSLFGNRYDNFKNSAIWHKIFQDLNPEETNINMDEIVNWRKILVARITGGDLSHQGETKNIISAMLSMLVANSAKNRFQTKKDEQPPFYIYLNEMKTWLHSPLTLIGWVKEFRKYNVSFVITSSTLQNFEEDAIKTLLSNTGTVIVFGLNEKDATILSKSLNFDVESVVQLKPLQFFVNWLDAKYEDSFEK